MLLANNDMRIRLLAIAGAPGVGKTTLMKRLMTSLGGFPPAVARKRGLVEYVLVAPGQTNYGEVIVLGRYGLGEVFEGTDKLSMAVQPEAERFVNEPPVGIRAIIFEGDRLCGSSFLKHCQAAGDFRLVILKASPNVLRERRSDRESETGKQQDPTWLAGRESKVAHITAQFAAGPIWVDDDAQMNHAVEELKGWVLGLTAGPPKIQDTLF